MLIPTICFGIFFSLAETGSARYTTRRSNHGLEKDIPHWDNSLWRRQVRGNEPGGSGAGGSNGGDGADGSNGKGGAEGGPQTPGSKGKGGNSAGAGNSGEGGGNPQAPAKQQSPSPSTPPASPEQGGGAAPDSSSETTPGLKVQVYKSIDGYEVSDLLKSPIYPNKPSSEDKLKKFHLEQIPGESLGARVFGYFKAPEDGDYTFYITSIAEGQLFLSTDRNPSNKRKIAETIGRQLPTQDEYEKFPNQKSKPIKLQKGKFYYIEALHKQLYGGNHLSVGAEYPSGKREFPLQVPDLYQEAPPEDMTAEARKNAPQVKIYSLTFPCPNPPGYTCKHALSVQKDGSVRLDSREMATSFLHIQPAVNGNAQAVTLEMAGKETYYLVTDGSRLWVRPDDGTKKFREKASFVLSSMTSVPDAQSIRPQYMSSQYICNSAGSGELQMSTLSDSCAFQEVHTLLDNNIKQGSCQNYCKKNETEETKEPKEKEEEEPSKWTQMDNDKSTAQGESRPGEGGTAGTPPGEGQGVTQEGAEGTKPKPEEPENPEEIPEENPIGGSLGTLVGAATLGMIGNHLMRRPSPPPPAVPPSQLNALQQQNIITQQQNMLQQQQQQLQQQQQSSGQQQNIQVIQPSTQTEAGSGSTSSSSPSTSSSSSASSASGTSSTSSSGAGSEVERLRDSAKDGRRYIAIRFINQVGSCGVRLVSNLKPEGYYLSTDSFKLKMIFKNQDFHKLLTFYGKDDTNKNRKILLDGKDTVSFTPTADGDNYVDVIVRAQPGSKSDGDDGTDCVLSYGNNKQETNKILDKDKNDKQTEQPLEKVNTLGRADKPEGDSGNNQTVTANNELTGHPKEEKVNSESLAAKKSENQSPKESTKEVYNNMGSKDKGQAELTVKSPKVADDTKDVLKIAEQVAEKVARKEIEKLTGNGTKVQPQPEKKSGPKEEEAATGSGSKTDTSVPLKNEKNEVIGYSAKNAKPPSTVKVPPGKYPVRSSDGTVVGFTPYSPGESPSGTRKQSPVFGQGGKLIGHSDGKVVTNDAGEVIGYVDGDVVKDDRGTILAQKKPEPAVPCKDTTTGGNANGACCSFPFIYKDTLYDHCVQDGSLLPPWCSTTSNFDLDGLWGNCGYSPPVQQQQQPVMMAPATVPFAQMPQQIPPPAAPPAPAPPLLQSLPPPPPPVYSLPLAPSPPVYNQPLQPAHSVYTGPQVQPGQACNPICRSRCLPSCPGQCCQTPSITTQIDPASSSQLNALIKQSMAQLQQERLVAEKPSMTLIKPAIPSQNQGRYFPQALKGATVFKPNNQLQQGFSSQGSASFIPQGYGLNRLAQQQRFFASQPKQAFHFNAAVLGNQRTLPAKSYGRQVNRPLAVSSLPNTAHRSLPYPSPYYQQTPKNLPVQSRGLFSGYLCHPLCSARCFQFCASDCCKPQLQPAAPKLTPAYQRHDVPIHSGRRKTEKEKETATAKKSAKYIPTTLLRDCEGGTPTLGGNAAGECCHFPFKVKGKLHHDCTKLFLAEKWCATTSDFDLDRKWGYCV